MPALAFFGTPGDACSSVKSPGPFAPLGPLSSWLMQVDDIVPMMGGQWQWLEWRAVSKTMQWCIGGSRVTFDLGRGPSQFISSAQTDFWEIAVIPGRKKKKRKPFLLRSGRAWLTIFFADTAVAQRMWCFWAYCVVEAKAVFLWILWIKVVWF